MSEENRMNERNEKTGEKDALNPYNKVRCFSFLYLLINILEFIVSEVLENVKNRNDGNKCHYLAICLIFLSLFRIGKFFTSAYFVYFIALQILEIAFEVSVVLN